MIEKTYWDEEETIPKEENHTNEKGEWHRVDGPAYQSWRKNEQKDTECWKQNGQHHRLDGPAHQAWDGDGQKEYESWDIFGVEVKL